MGSLHPTRVHSYLEKGKQSQSIMRAKLPFMTRLPKNRGITQAEEDKSLILRQNKPTLRNSVEKFQGQILVLVILEHDSKFQTKKALFFHFSSNHFWIESINSCS